MSKIYLIAGMLLFCLFTRAQLTARSYAMSAKGSGSDSMEYVTIGSIMPYQVAPFNWGNLSRFMNPSVFQWWLNGNTSGYKLLKKDGIQLLQPLPAPYQAFYEDSAIAIQWIKTGNYTIWVSEKSMPKNGEGCAQSSYQSLQVVVKDRPSVTWNSLKSLGGCNLANTVQQIPVKGTGSKKVSILYDVIHTPMEGISDTILNEVSFDVDRRTDEFSENLRIPIPADQYGTYEIKIKSIYDPVSYISGINSQPGDVPETPFTIVALPDPETGPIEFIQTLN